MSSHHATDEIRLQAYEAICTAISKLNTLPKKIRGKSPVREQITALEDTAVSFLETSGTHLNTGMWTRLTLMAESERLLRALGPALPAIRSIPHYQRSELAHGDPGFLTALLEAGFDLSPMFDDLFVKAMRTKGPKTRSFLLENVGKIRPGFRDLLLIPSKQIAKHHVFFDAWLRGAIAAFPEDAERAQGVLARGRKARECFILDAYGVEFPPSLNSLEKTTWLREVEQELSGHQRVSALGWRRNPVSLISDEGLLGTVPDWIG